MLAMVTRIFLHLSRLDPICIFSFFSIFFKSCLSLVHCNMGLFGKQYIKFIIINTKSDEINKKCTYNWIIPFPNKPWFLHVCSTSLLNMLREKEKLLMMSNFSFSHSVFYPFRELSAIFIKLKIVFCKLLQFGRVLNSSFGKGLNFITLRTKYFVKEYANYFHF